MFFRKLFNYFHNYFHKIHICLFSNHELVFFKVKFNKKKCFKSLLGDINYLIQKNILHLVTNGKNYLLAKLFVMDIFRTKIVLKVYTYICVLRIILGKSLNILL